MRRWTQPTAPSSPASSGNLPHHEEIAGRHPDQCSRASTAKCGRPHHNLSDFPDPDPRSRIPNPGMAYAKDRTSNVSPWGDRTSIVRWVSWRTGTGREGRKGTTWSPWTGQLWQRKSPKGITQGAAKGTRLLAIQDWMQGQIRASKGNKGSKGRETQGRELRASQ
jgi:hypothetical protein